MNRTWYQHLWFWKIAVLRCCIYGIIVAWGVIKAGTEGYASLADMTPMQFDKMMGDATVAFLGVILAFLDSTLSTLNSNANTRTASVTQTQTETISETVKPAATAAETKAP